MKILEAFLKDPSNNKKKKLEKFIKNEVMMECRKAVYKWQRDRLFAQINQE